MVQNMQVDFPGVLFTLGGLGMLVFELFVLLAALLLVNLRLRPPLASKPADAQSDIIAALTT
jgi:hypothetical protein